LLSASQKTLHFAIEQLGAGFNLSEELAARMAASAAKKSMPGEIGFARACQFISNRNFHLAAHI